MQKIVIITSWFVFSVLLFLYSFTQVDLSLTLSRASAFQSIEKNFQYIGYFNRPLSTYLYITLILLFSGAYFYTLILIKKKKLTRKNLWIIIMGITAILMFSYNAFSYDLFNYIFDAKIITHYGQNPYIHKALDFSGDPMLSFMHWTHRTYPYGPAWLAVTVPLSFIGLGYFLPTFFLFKILFGVSFLVCCYYIEKISEKIGLNPLSSVAVFALNPLVIVESLISGHLDITMMAFVMVSIYFFFQNKPLSSAVFWIVSICVKFATVFLAPVVLINYFFKRIAGEQIIILSTVFMALSIIAASLRTNYQPWYLLDVLPFAALACHKKYIFIPTIILSILSLFQYVPFLFLGNWDPPVPSLLNDILVTSIVLSCVYLLYYFVTQRKRV